MRKEIRKSPAYKTKEGEILHGYSQKNLELVYEQLKAVKKLGIYAILLVTCFLLLSIWIIWQVKHYGIVSIFLNRCV